MGEIWARALRLATPKGTAITLRRPLKPAESLSSSQQEVVFYCEGWTGLLNHLQVSGQPHSSPVKWGRNGQLRYHHPESTTETTNPCLIIKRPGAKGEALEDDPEHPVSWRYHACSVTSCSLKPHGSKPARLLFMGFSR